MDEMDEQELEGKMERSTLDRELARKRLEQWLSERLPKGAEPTISELSAPTGTGMSSETLLFDASWNEDGERRTRSLVGRLAPDSRDVPVFPRYDLEGQFRLLRLIADHADVPVPGVRWFEKESTVMGAPFFVMDRVEGRVPADIPPYLFGGWLLEAKPEERKELMEGTVAAIAGLHAIDPERAGADFLAFDVAGDTRLRAHVENQRAYHDWVVADGIRHPILERTFAWLEAHWPADEGAAVISWGDSRIGNVLYDGFRPAALLDWEMAGLGPRELDLGWLCFMHAFFQNIADMAEQPGLPDFLRLSDVAAVYERASGHSPRDLVWHFTYAALRHGIVMARIQRRMIHFGQAQWEEDPDTVIPHRNLLEGLLGGTWSPLT